MDKSILFLWVVGLAAVSAAELGLEGLKPAELKEIEKEIAAGNVPPNYSAEKPKRLVPKLTSADSAAFNHIGGDSSKSSYSTINPAAYAGQNPSFGAAPNSAYSGSPYNNLRLLYPNQYFPANQYLPYLQNPSVASQIAAQYAYQPSPVPQVPHYLQTPTQIQYVSPPNYQQAPSTQYKNLATKTPAASTPAVPVSSSANPTTSQVVIPSNMAYSQQPVLMLLYPQQQQLYHQQQQLYPQQQQFIYPGHQQMLLVSPQHQLLNLYGGQHRFSLPAYSSPAGHSQLAYLTVPGNHQQQLQPSVIQQQATELQKQPINVQETSPSQTYGLRTKA